MLIILSHTKWMILELLRSPAYVVSTIAFPALFYVIFAIPESRDAHSSNILVASFSCFAVFGVIFLQFGIGVAQERHTSWYQYLRTLPVSPYQLMMARFICALFFAFLAALGIILLSLFFTEVDLVFSEWLQFVGLLHMCAFVFCFMGLALGYWTDEKSSLPIGNLIYLPLSFVGGLWKPPSLLPDILKEISSYLPTRYYGEVMWSFVKGETLVLKDIAPLLAYGCLFALLAYIGFRRDQQVRFK